MKAYQLTAWQSEPELRDVAVPEPGPGEVLIKVAGAGACHSDLHLMEWPEGTMNFGLPFTLGHENAGWVEALGAGVEGLEVGEPVAVYGPWGCGRCRACRLSAETYCERQAEIGAFGGGLGLDGGMAEYMLVPHARLLLPLGELDPREAAPLSDAALTPYHAIKRSLGLLVPGSTAVVIGVGGLGHMAVQILRELTPSQIIAVDTSAEKLRLAREVGADEAIEPGEEAAETILELSHGHGAELVVDNVGADETLALGAKVVRFQGHLTMVGLAGGTFGFGFGTLPFEAQLTLPYWGTAVELMEVLELAKAGKIRAHVERFRLEQAAVAYEKMRAGELDGRAVICPHD
ncbi:MAG TPA: NAD(P)-dependent alcohol dehydrogenase [Solirubrobacterales bacterium]|nr:NAD(P)-dependent alcohol dehydrogenase [Solirubrobacterales bacterium]